MAYLISSDDNCVLNGCVYDNVPLVMSNRHRPVDEVNAFIRSAMRSRREVPGSVRDKANTLTNMCTFLEKDEAERARHHNRPRERDVRKLLREIDDDQLERWRDRDERAGVHPGTINTKLSVAFHFLLFCARTKGYPDRIADVNINPEAPVKVWFEKRQYRKVVLSNLLYKGPKTKSKKKGVPTVEEMEDAYVRASEGRWDIAARDVLMLNIAEDTGLRLAEVLNLRVSQLPDHDAIDAAEAADEENVLKVRRKGGAVHDAPFPAEVLRALHDYVRDVRPNFTKARDVDDRIFLGRSGKSSFNPQYMSRRLRLLFRDSKKERRLTYHRVRARFATIAVALRTDEEIEQTGCSILNIRENKILHSVAALMGQTDIESLRPYLDIEISKRLKLESSSGRRPKAGPASTS